MKSKYSLAALLILGIASLAAAQNIASPGCYKGGMNCNVKDDDDSSMIRIVWDGLKNMDAAIGKVAATPCYGNAAYTRTGICSENAQTPSVGQEQAVKTTKETQQQQGEHYSGVAFQYVLVVRPNPAMANLLSTVYVTRDDSGEITGISLHESCGGGNYNCPSHQDGWPYKTSQELKSLGITIHADGKNVRVETADGKFSGEPFYTLHQVFSRS